MPEAGLKQTLQGGKQTSGGLFDKGRRRQRNDPREVRAFPGEPGFDHQPLDAVGELDQSALAGNPHSAGTAVACMTKPSAQQEAVTNRNATNARNRFM